MPRDSLLKTPITVALGDSLSANSVSLEGHLLVGLVLPDAMEGAGLSFQVGLDAAVFRNFFQSSGVEKTFVVAAGQHILVVPEDFAGVPYLRVRFGTAAAPQVQSAERTITLVLRPL